MRKSTSQRQRPSGPNVFGLLAPYRLHVAILVALTVIANGLGLAIPKLLERGIDKYTSGTFSVGKFGLEFGLVAVGIFIFTYLQNVAQTYTSERVARDLRITLTGKISEQDYATVQQLTPAKLLTNLTSDIDAIKNFVSIAVASIISSAFLIIGTSVMLLLINWRLALVVLLVIPVIGGTMLVVFGRIRQLFKQSQESIDRLNHVINESILGSSLIRLLNAQHIEYDKFVVANTESKNIGMSILRLFASMIPIITFATNLAMLVILMLGGHFVIAGSLSLGGFTAFFNYLSILIFPILILGFTSNVIAQASASYARISEVLTTKRPKSEGTLHASTGGGVSLDRVRIKYGEKYAVKDVSFSVSSGSRTAIIGPTAAGKTQLLYALTGLITPTSGTVTYANRPLSSYDPVSLHRQIAFVFQDSVLFNLSLRENIAFSDTVKDSDLKKAIATAELSDFIEALPDGLDTIVSERGTSLSGGQKQRIMLARALALNPSVLLLDDFTARVDLSTEQRILANVQKNYPGLTLISVTQKIESVTDYDQIILLMEGELLARGTHEELMTTSPEYVQIFESQQSTSRYELQPESREQ